MGAASVVLVVLVFRLLVEGSVATATCSWLLVKSRSAGLVCARSASVQVRDLLVDLLVRSTNVSESDGTSCLMWCARVSIWSRCFDILVV